MIPYTGSPMAGCINALPVALAVWALIALVLA